MQLPEPFVEIGSVSEGAGVTVDGTSYDGPTGHTHF
jgi:thiamine-monophosphate kinase